MQIRSGVKCALTTALATMLIFIASGAQANGRFPRGEHVIEYPSDPNKLLLAATYGLLNTSDGGKNWYYVCETAFSLYPPDPGYTGDPIVALTGDESLLAGVQTRVTKSSDAACNWMTSYDAPNGGAVDDIAVYPGNRNIAVALVRTSANVTQVWETTNSGATWAAIGTPLTMIVLGYTIDIDPTDPMHLMVSGITSYDPTGTTGVFLNTTNHGTSWASSPIPKTNTYAAPYIAAVHPTDGKKVFVRTDEWTDNANGGTDARDALLYTKDGGQTWIELLRPTGAEGNGAKLYGFALSPDATTVLAGFGDPVEGGGRTVDRLVMGVYKSTGADYSFGAMPQSIFLESATCITWTTKGIYICGSPDGMTSYIGFASDVSMVNSAGLTKIMEVDKLKGEPPCCAGRAVTTCDWNVDCIRFSACSDSGTSSQPDAAACMMPDAGRDGSAGAGGSSGGDASADRSGGSGGGAGTDGGANDASTGGAGAGGVSGGAGRAGASTGGAGTGGASTGGASGSGTGGAGTGGSGGGVSCSCRIASTSSGRPLAALSLLLGLVGANGRRRARGRPRKLTQ